MCSDGAFFPRTDQYFSDVSMKPHKGANLSANADNLLFILKESL